MIPKLFGSRDQFCGRQLFHGLGLGGGGLWFGDDARYYIYCLVYLYYYYTSSLDELRLAAGGWGALP